MKDHAVKALKSKLNKRFPEAVVHDQSESTIAVFEPINQEFGDVVVSHCNEEIIIFIGRFTHLHFAILDNPELTEDVIEFLDDLFSDQIECFLTENGGGFRNLKYSSDDSKTKLKNRYVWSGNLGVAK